MLNKIIEYVLCSVRICLFKLLVEAITGSFTDDLIFSNNILLKAVEWIFLQYELIIIYIVLLLLSFWWVSSLAVLLDEFYSKETDFPLHERETESEDTNERKHTVWNKTKDINEL